MRNIQFQTGSPALLCSAATALALPPPDFALVPGYWSGKGTTVPELEVAIWADGAVDLTGATLYGAQLRPYAPSALAVTGTAAVAGSLDLSTKTTDCDTVIEAGIAGAAPTEPGDGITIAFAHSVGAPNAGVLTNVGLAYTFTFKTAVTTVANFEAAIAALPANPATGRPDLVVKTPGTPTNVLAVTVDEFAAAPLTGAADAVLTHTAHGLLIGDGPFQLTDAGGSLPTGLALLTDYYVVKVGANTFNVATSITTALSGVVVEFTTNGTGTIDLNSSSSTKRVHWHSMGLLGLAGDGAIDLDAQSSYWDVRKHSPMTIAYALVATIASGSGAITAGIIPRVDRE
jgi:hypothetical protein